MTAPVVPDAIWWLWEQCATFIPGVQLGGIYALKSGYHSTVQDNQARWPGDYSIRLAVDLVAPHDKARALDLTMDADQMRLRTGYLQAAALHPDDNRLDGLREFYGTLDGTTVFGLSHDGPGQGWYRVASDSSHLWHIHLSVFTAHCNGQAAMAAVASVLRGDTWEQWQAGASAKPEEGNVKFTTREPDNGRVWLCDLIVRRHITTPQEWERILQWGASGRTDRVTHIGDVPPGESIDWYGYPIDATAQTIVMSSEQVAEVLARVEAAARAGAEAGAPTAAEIADAVVDEEHQRLAQ